MTTEIHCPRGHFLGELLIDLSEVVLAERRRCRGCKQDVYVLAANGVLETRAVV